MEGGYELDHVKQESTHPRVQEEEPILLLIEIAHAKNSYDPATIPP